MTTPPAAWYDDPEDASHYRFWDGTNWTNHRSPKGLAEPVTADPSQSAWNIFPDTFNAIGATWRQLLVISTANIVMTAIVLVVAYATVDAVFDGELGEMIDRLNDGSRSAADDAYFDRLDASFPGSVFWVAVAVGAVWFVIGSMVSAAVQRTLAASMRGHHIEPSDAIRGAGARTGRVLTWSLLLWSLLLALVFVLIALLGALPLGALATVPVIVFAAPYALGLHPAIAIAPQGRNPLSQARDVVKGRWVAMARRALVYVLLWFVVIFCGLLAGQFFAADLRVAVVGLAAAILVQNVVLAAGLVAFWVGSDGPVDPDLVPAAPDGPT